MFYKKGINTCNSKEMFEFLKNHSTYNIKHYNKVRHYENNLKEESVANRVISFNINLFLEEEQYSIIDALIFKKYFINHLNIKKRYVGEETVTKMVKYNNILKEILQEKLVIIDRLKEKDEVISASKVRMLLQENKIDEALEYVPREISFILRSIARQRYGN